MGRKPRLIPVDAHEELLRTFPCAISRNPKVTLHHTRGGSIAELGWGVGIGQKQNPFLQIPLHSHYHVGPWGIDSGVGVEAWESMFGTQVQMLQWVNERLSYDLWDQALWWHAENRTNTTPGRRPDQTD
jgi:hypothetical protein